MSLDPRPEQEYWNGKWPTLEGDVGWANRNPSTGGSGSLARSASSTPVDDAVRSARAALPEWRGIAIEDRARLLESVEDRLDQSRDSMARRVTEEIGTPITRSKQLQIQNAIPSDATAGSEQYESNGGVDAWEISLKCMVLIGNRFVAIAQSVADRIEWVLSEQTRFLNPAPTRDVRARFGTACAEEMRSPHATRGEFRECLYRRTGDVHGGNPRRRGQYGVDHQR